MTRFSELATPTATRAYLERWGLHTKKSLGQHFLIDDGVVGRIIKLAEVVPGDQIIEVGPGIGTLTLALLDQKATVNAIEKDQNLLKPLANLCADKAGFSLIAADALDLSVFSDKLYPVVAEADSSRGSAPVKLVANLPYAVAATIVLLYFEKLPHLSSATIMVQREVANRMAAQPGTKDYGAYTVKLQALTEPVGSFLVARTNFMPPPNVDSTVIRLDRLTQPLNATHYQATAVLADAAFYQRRKTIQNSMRAYFSESDKHASSGISLDQEAVGRLLEQTGIDPRRRGETLRVKEFIELGNAAMTCIFQ